MEKVLINLHTQFQIGQVDPRIFGGFLEHMGLAVYQGVYNPECEHADKDGFRTDTLGALRRLKMTAMRYPGGNFASGYHWLDGVGPRLSTLFFLASSFSLSYKRACQFITLTFA